MPALSAHDLLRPVSFRFCHRMFLFRFLELDAACQGNKFIEYEHERASCMPFFLTAEYVCVYVCLSIGCHPDSGGGHFLYVLRGDEGC